MKFFNTDVKIEEIIPTMGKKLFEVNFTIDGEWYQFMYYPDNPTDNYFSDLPEEFEPYTSVYSLTDRSVEEEFTKLVKNFELKKSLTPNTAKTFEDIIDEL
jgi:hypothetical protein